jgi:hypothetical protein
MTEQGARRCIPWKCCVACWGEGVVVNITQGAATAGAARDANTARHDEAVRSLLGLALIDHWSTALSPMS